MVSEKKMTHCLSRNAAGGISFCNLVNYLISRLVLMLQWENAMTITERMNVAGMDFF